MSEEIAQTGKVIRQAENDLPKITASLPTVRLPTSSTWMFHTERAGSDGTIKVEVTERGSGVSVQQTWTGGDGSMAGTVTVTTIPFDDIGKVELRPRMEKGDETSTVFVQAGRNFFPETLNSPLRNTPKRVLPAVNLTTTRSFVYLLSAIPPRHKTLMLISCTTNSSADSRHTYSEAGLNCTEHAVLTTLRNGAI